MSGAETDDPVSPETAVVWVDRWEAQQELYATGREERSAVVADVVAHATRDRDRPVVVDLGGGPGSLAARIAARLPYARVVSVDCDPLLLALGRARHGAAVDFVDARVGEPGWSAALPRHRPLDAVVSATALHYLPPATLAAVYEEVHDLLRPGGVLVNADHLFQQDAPVRDLAAAVARGRAARNPRGGPVEDWQEWWRAVAACGEFDALLAERDCRGLGPGGDNGLTLPDHADLLRTAGFPAVGSVWQYGHSCVLVAVRS